MHLVEISVMEQRYQAVMAVVQDGWKVAEVADRLGVTRVRLRAASPPKSTSRREQDDAPNARRHSFPGCVSPAVSSRERVKSGPRKARETTENNWN